MTEDPKIKLAQLRERLGYLKNEIRNTAKRGIVVYSLIATAGIFAEICLCNWLGLLTDIGFLIIGGTIGFCIAAYLLIDMVGATV